jgi:predicted NAD/FAD-binding protein
LCPLRRILHSREWDYITVHNAAFEMARRNLHKIQGLDRIYYAGAVTAINLHEWAILSGLSVAAHMGAPYPFERDAKAKASFLAMKAQMYRGAKI